MKAPPGSERLLGLGLQLAGSILAGFFLGFFLDRKYGTLPWCTLAGVSIGLTAGFVNFFIQLRSIENSDRRL